MNYSRTYKGIIWTNHALERLRTRKIPQESAWKAFRFPDSTQKGKTNKSIELVKTINNHTLAIVAKQNDQKEWIILSVWIDPPLSNAQELKEEKNTTILQSIFRLLRYIFFK